MERILSGKGVWIWQVAQCEGGDLAKIVDRARGAGLTHVLVKGLDGTHLHNEAVIEDLGIELHKVGIQLIPWQYTRGQRPLEEADAAYHLISDLRCSTFVVNAEAEYKGHADSARTYIEELRGKTSCMRYVGRVHLALSSYYLPDNHPDYPWAQFMQFIDLWMPQIYWFLRDPVWALEEALRQSDKFGVPRFVTGAVYKEGMGKEENLQRFVDAVARKKLWGCNFWSWQHMSEGVWDIVTRLEISE